MDLQLCVLAYRHSITIPPPSCLPLSSFASARRANRFTRTCFAPWCVFFVTPSCRPRGYIRCCCLCFGREGCRGAQRRRGHLPLQLGMRFSCPTKVRGVVAKAGSSKIRGHTAVVGKAFFCCNADGAPSHVRSQHEKQPDQSLLFVHARGSAVPGDPACLSTAHGPPLCCFIRCWINRDLVETSLGRTPSRKFQVQAANPASVAARPPRSIETIVVYERLRIILVVAGCVVNGHATTTRHSSYPSVLFNRM